MSKVYVVSVTDDTDTEPMSVFTDEVKAIEFVLSFKLEIGYDKTLSIAEIELDSEIYRTTDKELYKIKSDLEVTKKYYDTLCKDLNSVKINSPIYKVLFEASKKLEKLEVEINEIKKELEKRNKYEKYTRG
jgi:archaellum component FlaC